MDVVVQIIASGLTMGAMYAISTIGLALVYGSLNMLNMSHGALLALGGYICYFAMTHLGCTLSSALPPPCWSAASWGWVSITRRRSRC